MKKVSFLILLFFTVACREKPRHLPLLGEPHITTIRTPAGLKQDTVFPVIPAFSFLDQERRPVSNKTLAGKNYIADFFFTSCPTICPVMSHNLSKVYAKFKHDPRLKYVSFTIDPKHDSIPVLKRYANNLGADPSIWHFVTGPQEEIYRLALKGFYSTANKDDKVAGGFVHSSGLMLVDKDGHLRWVYDGTSDREVEQLIAEVDQLLNEQSHPNININNRN